MFTLIGMGREKDVVPQTAQFLTVISKFSTFAFQDFYEIGALFMCTPFPPMCKVAWENWTESLPIDLDWLQVHRDLIMCFGLFRTQMSSSPSRSDCDFNTVLELVCLQVNQVLNRPKHLFRSRRTCSQLSSDYTKTTV